jgi:hypothetical protein
VSLQAVEKADAEKYSLNSREQSANPEEVFLELFGLLEEYGPSWYTEEQHNRALAAFRVLYRSNHVASAPIPAGQP